MFNFVTVRSRLSEQPECLNMPKSMGSRGTSPGEPRTWCLFFKVMLPWSSLLPWPSCRRWMQLRGTVVWWNPLVFNRPRVKCSATAAILPEILCSQYLSWPIVWYMSYALNPWPPTYSIYRHSRHAHWNRNIYSYSTYPGTSGQFQLPFWRILLLNSAQPKAKDRAHQLQQDDICCLCFSFVCLFVFKKKSPQMYQLTVIIVSAWT